METLKKSQVHHFFAYAHVFNIFVEYLYLVQVTNE
jgi:hypothetical protein